MWYLAIFRLEIEKTVVIFEMSNLNFFNMRSFMVKLKCLFLGQKLV